MISIDDRIRCSFSDSAVIFPEKHITRKLRSNVQQRGGYLVLQLHDELLYEVSITVFVFGSNLFKLFPTHCEKYNFIVFYILNLYEI